MGNASFAHEQSLKAMNVGVSAASYFDTVRKRTALGTVIVEPYSMTRKMGENQRQRRKNERNNPKLRNR